MRRSMTTGFLALLGVGLYYSWRNRFRIQEFLESQGIRTPIDTSSVGNVLRTGVAKVKGSVDHAINNADNVSRRAM